MAGIKIINVLKDDTFPEILEIFRQTDAGEVFFVLPKKSKVFRREDHFAAFASEAAGSGKIISILCSNAEVNALARKYKFQVMSASKSSPPPHDDDIKDFSKDAFSEDGLATSDETMGNTAEDKDENEETQDDEEKLPSEPAEDDTLLNAELTAAGMDGLRPGSPRTNVPIKGKIERPSPVPVDHSAQADWDYIDTVWREKAAAQGRSTPVRRGGGSASKKIAVGILLVSLVILSAVVYLTTGSASIKLSPVAKPVNAEIPVQASDTFSSIDASFGKIPGQIVEVTKSVTQEAPATGQRDIASKARGKITITNEFSSAPQPLVATTRFESSTGIIVRTLQSITVPGSTVQNGKLVAGSVSVDVIADKPGIQYNIAATKFTIPAFKERGDADKYAKIYGQSTEAFSGGANGPSKFVTQADYDAAKEIATKSVQDEIAKAFAGQSAGMMILSDIKPTIGAITSTAKADDAADSFKVTVSATLKTVSFRQKDLHQLIADTILKKDRLVVMPEKLELSYRDIVFKSDLGILTFSVVAKGNGYMPIDQASLSGDILGMSSQAIRDYFKNREDVQTATIVLSPFWVRSVPKTSSRIKLQLDYAPATP